MAKRNPLHGYKQNHIHRTIILLVGIAFMLPLPISLLTRQGLAYSLSDLPVTTPKPIQTVLQTGSAFILQTTESEPEPPENDLPPATFEISVFTIEIPRIQLRQNITPGVDPADEDKYMPILEESIAHGRYTSYPPDNFGNIYLFAHSRNAPEGITPPGGWFTRIDELGRGDVIFINFNNSTYTYTVTSLEIVDPSHTSIYRNDTIYENHSSLTLQTCYPRGQTSQRLIVYAIGG